MNLNEIFGYLLYRVNHTSEIGLSISEQRESQHRSFDSNEAIALIHDLAKAQMRTMKSYLAKGFFSNTNDLLAARKKLRLIINVELNDHGVAVDYVILIHVVNENENIPIEPSKSLHIVYKDGGDRSGLQTVWKSISMKDASDHLFQHSFVALHIEQDSTVTWKNPTSRRR